MFFKVEKASSLKGSLENPKWFFDGITVKQPFCHLYFLECTRKQKSREGNAICHPATQAVKAGSDGKTTCLHFPFPPSIMQIAVTPLPLNLLSVLSWELSLIRGRAHLGTLGIWETTASLKYTKQSLITQDGGWRIWHNLLDFIHLVLF